MCLSVALFSQNAQLFIVTPCCLMSQRLCFRFPLVTASPCGDSVAIAPVAVAVFRVVC